MKVTCVFKLSTEPPSFQLFFMMRSSCHPADEQHSDKNKVTSVTIWYLPQKSFEKLHDHPTFNCISKIFNKVTEIQFELLLLSFRNPFKINK